MIITNSNYFGNCTPPYWLVYCSAFFKWKESRFKIGNVHHSDLQSEMCIIRVVYIRIITLIALLVIDFDLLYNINKYFLK